MRRAVRSARERAPVWCFERCYRAGCARIALRCGGSVGGSAFGRAGLGIGGHVARGPGYLRRTPLPCCAPARPAGRAARLRLLALGAGWGEASPMRGGAIELGSLPQARGVRGVEPQRSTMSGSLQHTSHRPIRQRNDRCSTRRSSRPPATMRSAPSARSPRCARPSRPPRCTTSRCGRG